MKDLLIIIPAYNEADNISGVISQLHATADDPSILVVDDGSQDGTFDVCQKLGIKDSSNRIYDVIKKVIGENNG